jgi:hypothetical protein
VPSRHDDWDAVIAKLDSIEHRQEVLEKKLEESLAPLERLTNLFDMALTAVATESRNKADIAELRRRLEALEAWRDVVGCGP